jgi:transposase
MSEKYKESLNRNQQLLFPPSLDEYVDENNQVRAIDLYVEQLDFKELGFDDTSTSFEGQKSYSPKLLLKIYIYGYLNKIRSSRALEKENLRNIELMWLTSGLKPTYKTISDFRKNNPKALKQVFKDFVLLLKGLALIGDNLVALDGAFLRANASKNTLIMKKTTQRDLKEVDNNIDEYLSALQYSDEETHTTKLVKQLPRNLDILLKKKAKLTTELNFLEKIKRTQYNRTDPDASVMTKPAHNLMAYNSQICVDDKFKFIVATDVTSQGTDKQELHHMAMQTKEVITNPDLVVLADKGYYSATEIKKCVDDGIRTLVPYAQTGQQQKNAGKFTKDKFVYNTEKDCYICPNNEEIPKSISSNVRNGRLMFIYRPKISTCTACPIKDKCLGKTTRYKQIQRWAEQELLDKYYQDLETPESKALMKKRGSIVEHPFGTIKRNLGWDHFLVRSKKKVQGENALIMFTYNFKRLLNLIGIALFKKLLIALKDGDLSKIREEIALYIASFRLKMAIFLLNIFMVQFSKKFT